MDNGIIGSNQDFSVGETMDFSKVIAEQQAKAGPITWQGTVEKYFDLVIKHPELAETAPARVYRMLMKDGTSPIEDLTLKTKGYEDLVWYNFFNKNIYGSRTAQAIHDIMRFMKAAAMRTETGKRILLLMGPVSSGKSTIVGLMKKGLELWDEPTYGLVGCPLHEDPLNAIPVKDRLFWSSKLGVQLKGELCPVCQFNLETEYTDDQGFARWHKMPIERVNFSEQKRCGIGTFQPSDPKSQDISELIGRVNMSQLAIYDETDPRSYSFNGELQVANRGIMEYIEILKADIKFHYTLITVAQEQKIKAPGFPMMDVDTCLVSHTNQVEFDKFANDPTNEALHDRIYYVKVPWNDSVTEEVKIYQKLIDESEFKDIHIAPHTLKLAAQFAILSRLKESTICTDLIKKMKLYDGEEIDEFSQGRDVDVKELREEAIKKDECMVSGVSPRFITDAINVIMASKTDTHKCVTALDLLTAIRDNFKHHLGHNEKDQERYMNLLMGDKGSIVAEYKEFAKNEVSKAFVHAFEDQADELYRRYELNAKAYCKKEKIYNQSIGTYEEPDEDIMRSIEQLVPVPQESKSEFRKQLFVIKSDYLSEGKEFDWTSYPAIKYAIEKKLMSDLKNVVTLSIADTTATDVKTKGRKNRAMRTLLKKGYCEHCATQLLAFIGEVLRRENS